MKFGGSSVADAKRILATAEIVRARVALRPLVVVSALGGVTDLLLQAFSAATQGERERIDPILADVERRHRWALGGLALSSEERHLLTLEIDRWFEVLRQRLRSVRILGEGTARACDAVLACGEQLASRLVAAGLTAQGLAARWIDPETVMATDDRFGAAEPDEDRVRELTRSLVLPILQAGEIPVTGGFVGRSPTGDTTTLGRGGSDTSAAVLGLALDADEIQIWTDVDGLMSADPRLVPAARTLPQVTFAEAAELAFYGARVLHPHSIAPAVARAIPVRILNSLRPEGPGTLVVDDAAGTAAHGPVAVASREIGALIVIRNRRMRPDLGLPARVLAALAGLGCLPELLVATETAMTLAVARVVSREALASALGPDLDVEVREGRALLCVVGAGLNREPLRGRVLAEMAHGEAEMVAAGAGRASVAVVLERAGLAEAVGRLHRRFFEQASVS